MSRLNKLETSCSDCNPTNSGRTQPLSSPSRRVNVICGSIPSSFMQSLETQFVIGVGNHASTPPLKFLQAGCPSCRPTNSIKALMAHSNHIITRISIQTTGLAFGGTGQCSYHVRGVDGSRAEHLTVESYTVIICQQLSLLLFGFPSPTHSFIPGLKPSFSANPSHRSPSFFFFRIHYMDSPDCLLLLLSISVVYFLVFLFLHFLVVGSVR